MLITFSSNRKMSLVSKNLFLVYSSEEVCISLFPRHARFIQRLSLVFNSLFSAHLTNYSDDMKSSFFSPLLNPMVFFRSVYSDVIEHLCPSIFFFKIIPVISSNILMQDLNKLHCLRPTVLLHSLGDCGYRRESQFINLISIFNKYIGRPFHNDIYKTCDPSSISLINNVRYTKQKIFTKGFLSSESN